MAESHIQEHIFLLGHLIIHLEPCYVFPTHNFGRLLNIPVMKQGRCESYFIRGIYYEVQQERDNTLLSCEKIMNKIGDV